MIHENVKYKKEDYGVSDPCGNCLMYCNQSKVKCAVLIVAINIKITLHSLTKSSRSYSHDKVVVHSNAEIENIALILEYLITLVCESG